MGGFEAMSNEGPVPPKASSHAGAVPTTTSVDVAVTQEAAVTQQMKAKEPEAPSIGIVKPARRGFFGRMAAELAHVVDTLFEVFDLDDPPPPPPRKLSPEEQDAQILHFMQRLKAEQAKEQAKEQQTKGQQAKAITNPSGMDTVSAAVSTDIESAVEMESMTPSVTSSTHVEASRV